MDLSKIVGKSGERRPPPPCVLNSLHPGYCP